MTQTKQHEKASEAPEASEIKNRNQADDLRLCAQIYGRQSPEFTAMLKRQKGVALRDQQAQIARKLASAEALAEALRDLHETCERIGPPPITKGGLCEENDWQYDMRKAKAALAQWDSSQ